MQDMELGKMVAKTVVEKKLPQESLCSEYKDALDLYWNKKQLMDIDNVILKPWQSALIEYMERSKREVIWVQGAKCEELKNLTTPIFLVGLIYRWGKGLKTKNICINVTFSYTICEK